MKKHKFNIFPEAKLEDFQRLRDDIQENGFDKKQPVTIFQGDVLDGWNRWRACEELKIIPPTVQFIGSEAEAIAFVMRTNKRRNLNSGQWACIAAEADAILQAIADAVEKERREKISSAMTKPKDEPAKIRQKIVESSPKEDKSLQASHKIAAVFGTNRTYVSQAVKIKEKAPEVFEKVKAGKMTMQDANKVVRAIPTDDWRGDERERQKIVESGLSVVANAQSDKNLIAWAEKKRLAVRIDRGTKYGNPFVLNEDGDRGYVCDCYEKHYLPHKHSIADEIATLCGKVLVCHCYPQRCHGDSLAKLANKSR